MLDRDDAKKVAEALAQELYGVSKNQKNFAGLPDKYWGYYARGRHKEGVFGMIVMYSESGDDIDNIMKQHEKWLSENTSASP